MYEQGDDLGTGALAQLRATGPSENYPFSYDANPPFAFPSPKELLAAARESVAAGAESSTLQYFSAEGEDEAIADGDPGFLREGTPPTPAQRRKPKQPGPEKLTSSGRSPTVATLAASIEQLIQLNAGLTQSVSSLAQRQTQLEKRSDPAAPEVQVPSSVLRRPISASLAIPAVSAGAVAKTLATPRLLPHWDSCHRHNFSLQISWSCRRRSPNRSSISLQII